MPIFKELNVITITQTNEPTGTCNGSTDDAGNVDDADGCYSDGGEFTHDITYTALNKDTTINLDLISSFEVGKHLYPSGGNAVGDEDVTRTMVTFGTNATTILVDESLAEFRATMAQLY